MKRRKNQVLTGMEFFNSIVCKPSNRGTLLMTLSPRQMPDDLLDCRQTEVVFGRDVTARDGFTKP